MFDQGALAGVVPVEHTVNLGDSEVGLVHHQEKVLREVIKEGGGATSGGAPVQVTGVVLDTGAKPHLQHHFQVVAHALLQALQFQEAPRSPKLGQPAGQFRLDTPHGRPEPLPGGNVMGGGENGGVGPLPQRPPGEKVDLPDPLDLVPEQLHPQGRPGEGGGNDLDYIPPHPEGAPVKVDVVALVLHSHQPLQDLVPAGPGAYAQRENLIGVLPRVP